MTAEKTQKTNLETILRPGQVVGDRYCVDRLIGKGGMAAVWAGTNQRTGKRVALKVILRSFASTAEADEMFRREALAASRVNHPNVVNVFDVIDHDGMACIVMELLDGEPLSAYLSRKGLLSVEEAIALILPAMRGVAAANAQGIVHRDLKPQNIFVCIGSDGSILTTKVLDFGISVVVAKALDAEVATVVTTHGTPAYMSPEHITNASDIDERADVYGFGILLFESLTGQVPFAGEPGPSLLMRILNDPPPKASFYRPDLRPALVSIIDRALAKNREDRFPTLNHFIRVLEEHFLPTSPLPRSLTPMVGVPLLERASGVADPVVQMVRQGEGSGMHRLQQTRALFALPMDADGESSRRFVTLNRSLTDTATTGKAPFAQRIGSKGRTMLASVGAFLGALLLVGWLAMPRHDPPPTPALQIHTAPVGGPVPLAPAANPAPTIPEGPPTPARVETPPEAPLQARTQVSVTEPEPDRLVPAAAKRSGRPAAVKGRTRPKVGVEEALSIPLLAPPALAPPPEPPAPAASRAAVGSRAGTLSPDDF